MIFVLVNTAYRADTETVEEMYIRLYDENEIGRTDWFEISTSKLSLAETFSSCEAAEKYMVRHKINDHKIVPIKTEDLFVAKLAAK